MVRYLIIDHANGNPMTANYVEKMPKYLEFQCSFHIFPDTFIYFLTHCRGSFYTYIQTNEYARTNNCFFCRISNSAPYIKFI